MSFLPTSLGAYDESFWGEYNFISPEESLEEAVVKLAKKKVTMNSDRTRRTGTGKLTGDEKKDER